MDDPLAAATGPGAVEKPQKPVRTPRLDRAHTPTPVAVAGSAGRPLALTGTPLVASRSVGPLLGVTALSFKLESLQPTGTWLDRGAARVVGESARGGRGVLGVVGAGPLTHALAAQCARVGRLLVALLPAASCAASGWLDALGVSVVVVDTDEAALRLAAPEMLAQVGGQYVDESAVGWHGGLRELLQEIAAEGRPDALLAIPGVVGLEAHWLAAVARDGRSAVPLPLDGMGGGDERQFAVLGVQAESSGSLASIGAIVQQPVTAREAVAAQRLLAREEGIVASAWGAAGLAALIRAVQEDRRAPLRARRLPRELSAVVVVMREHSDSGGPPLAPDTLPRRTVTMAEAQSGMARLLVYSVSDQGD